MILKAHLMGNTMRGALGLVLLLSPALDAAAVQTPTHPTSVTGTTDYLNQSGVVVARATWRVTTASTSGGTRPGAFGTATVASLTIDNLTTACTLAGSGVGMWFDGGLATWNVTTRYSVPPGGTITISTGSYFLLLPSVINGVGMMASNFYGVDPTGFNARSGSRPDAFVAFQGGCFNQSTNPPPAISSFTATPTSITVGQSSTLQWSATNSTSVSIDQGIGNVATNGSRSVSPTTTTTYTLTATGAGGTTSQSVTVTVVSASPPLSVNCPATAAGTLGTALSNVTCTASGGTPPYSFTASGLPAGLSMNASSGVISGTPTASGTFTVTVTVTENASPRATATRTITLTVAPAPTTSLTVTCLQGGQGQVGVPFNTSQTTVCAASNGTAPYTWSATGLPAGLSINSSNSAITGTPTTAGNFTATVTVSDSSSPRRTGTQTATFTVSAAAPLSISTFLANGATSPTSQPTLTLALSSAPTTALSGTLTLTFTPDTSVTGLPANYVDRAAVFSNGQRTLNFTVAAGATTVTLPANGQFSLGTVAGSVRVTLSALTQGSVSVLPTAAPVVTIAVPASPPVITAGSVRLNNTASGFTLEVQGYSTTRDLTNATVQFTGASGANLGGSTTATVPLNVVSPSWFSSQAGLDNGSQFLLQIPFGFSGDTSAIGSVSVILANRQGASAAVSGR